MAARNPDEEAAAQMVAGLEILPSEEQERYRWAFTVIAIEWGIVELVALEVSERGMRRLVCRHLSTDACYAVDRPGDWSHAEEDALVVQLKERLERSGADPV